MRYWSDGIETVAAEKIGSWEKLDPSVTTIAGEIVRVPPSFFDPDMVPNEVDYVVIPTDPAQSAYMMRDEIFEARFQELAAEPTAAAAEAKPTPA